MSTNYSLQGSAFKAPSPRASRFKGGRLKDTFDFRPKSKGKNRKVKSASEDGTRARNSSSDSDSEISDIPTLSRTQETSLIYTKPPVQDVTTESTAAVTGPPEGTHIYSQTDEEIGMSTSSGNPYIRTIPTSGPERHTPDHVIHTGERVINRQGPSTSGGMATFNPPNIITAKSMRQQLTSLERESPTSNRADTSGVNIEMRPSQGGTLESTKSEGDKSKPMAHKYILFILMVMILLAGVVAVVVLFRNKDKADELGSKTPDPITYNECVSAPVSIGSPLNFTCRFNVLHEYRKQLKTTNVTITVHNNRGEEISDIRHVYVIEGSDRILTLSSGPGVSCSDVGEYRIKIWNGVNTLLHEARVFISVSPSTVKSEMRQMMVADSPRLGCNDDKSETVFRFTCSIQNDCNNYDVDIFGKRNGREISFKYKMDYNSNFSDTDGYSTQTKVEFTESEVENYANLGCKFVSAQRTHRKYFELPDCNYHENCTQSGSRWYFNCTKNSTHLRNVAEGACSISDMTRCFDEDRTIYTYQKGQLFDGKFECDGTTVPVCRLSWCKRGTRILKYENPAEILCIKPEFEEITPSN